MYQLKYSLVNIFNVVESIPREWIFALILESIKFNANGNISKKYPILILKMYLFACYIYIFEQTVNW